MSELTLAERTVDVLLDARRPKPASAEPSSADDIGLDPGEFVKSSVGLGMFMTPMGAADKYTGPRKQDGERAWKKRLTFEGLGEVRITVYKKTVDDWYIHLLYDPEGMWHHERPHKHLYFGFKPHLHLSSGHLEERVIRCMKWLIETLKKQLSEVQAVDPNDPRIAGDQGFKQRNAVGRAVDAFNKVDTALAHGSYMPDEPPPSNEWIDNMPPEEVEEATPRKPRAAVPPPPKEDPIEFSPDEMKNMFYTSQKFGPILRLSAEMDKWGEAYIGGEVTRDRGSHYVHENTVTFDMDGDASNWFDPKTDETLTEAQYMPINHLISQAEELMTEHVRSICQAIYKSLESEYEYLFHGEGAEESIRANEYEFDEEGNRVEGGPLQYDQLDDDAKSKAKEWYADGASQDEWWDGVYGSWKERLPEMGFGDDAGDIDIAFSGFWSQGDGASFTCPRFYFKKYVQYLVLGKAKDLNL